MRRYDVSGFPPDQGPDQGPGGFGFNPSDLGAMFGQLSRMFSGSGDPLDPANLGTQARQQLAQFGPDPSVADAEKNAVRAAADLADLWVDAATDMRSVTRHAQAWSRAEWVEATVPAWRDLLGPVISGMHNQSLTDLGNASSGLATGGEAGLPGIDLGALQQMIGPMLGAMLGGQVATGIAKLASEVLGAADVGLPLAPTGVSALVPANVKAFADGLERPFDEVRLYLALRESAHARLFASTPWLTSTISSVLTSAAAGSTPKLGNLSELMGSIDPNNPEEAMQTIAARMEESTDTPEQHARENQLETVLALVIGWVDDVVTGAAAGRLPAEPALQEALRRRRATGGPAEQVFAEIAGLELRPRRVRDAAALWAKLREAGGEATRDRVWSHPDFLPGSADLDDPDAFVASFMAPEPDFSALDELTRPRTDEERLDDERRDRDGDEPDDQPGDQQNGPASS
jgi:putative hydrolase